MCPSSALLMFHFDIFAVTSTPLREFSSTTDAPLIDESDILILACLGAGVIISAFIICAVTFGCLQWRGRYLFTSHSMKVR